MMITTVSYKDDPFFEIRVGGSSAEWNACIGNQGNEASYVEGYVDAAIGLVGTIFEKKLWEKRDTLVLPILYNARHAIELALKFATVRFARAGVIENNELKTNHDIKTYWNHLHNSANGDEELSQTIDALKPYVDSLANVDSDGQELRYHQNRQGNQSLSEYTLVNLELVRHSLNKLKELILNLMYRTLVYIDEWKTGSCTNRCSRTDLLTIAELMPPRCKWDSELFTQRKEVVKSRYKLNNGQFSKALDCIQNNREMRSILGIETPLLYLTDNDIIWIIKQWQRLHPAQPKDTDPLVWNNLEQRLARNDRRTQSDVIQAIETRLSLDKLIELEKMFYLARDATFVEYYERDIENKRHKVDDMQSIIRNLMEKTNFLCCMRNAAIKLGRLSLGQQLREMQAIF